MTGHDWRAARVDEICGLIKEAEPDAVEERKWQKASNPDGVPTFSLDGLICTVETYKDKVKITFARGGALDDPDGMFNTPGATRRAIDLYQDDVPDPDTFKALVNDAVRVNRERKSK